MSDTPTGDDGPDPSDWTTQVETLCAEADAHFASLEFDRAIALYDEALALLPPDARRGPTAALLHVAAGDAHLFEGRVPEAETAYRAALECGDEPNENPYLNLRLGQTALERGDLDEALERLAAARELAGDEIFRDEDPKYLAFLDEHPTDFDDEEDESDECASERSGLD